jgi:hypothetical protein
LQRGLLVNHLSNKYRCIWITKYEYRLVGLCKQGTIPLKFVYLEPSSMFIYFSVILANILYWQPSSMAMDFSSHWLCVSFCAMTLNLCTIPHHVMTDAANTLSFSPLETTPSITMMMNPSLATKAALCLVAVAALVATSMRSKDVSYTLAHGYLSSNRAQLLVRVSLQNPIPHRLLTPPHRLIVYAPSPSLLYTAYSLVCR